MRFLVFGAVILAVAFASNKGKRSESEVNDSQSPWRAGQIYRYDIKSQTLASQPGSAATGQAFRAQLTIRVKAPGQIKAKLNNAEYAHVHDELQNTYNQAHAEQLPENMNYQPAQNLDDPFEIYVNGGRVVSLKLSASVPLPQENLLKGLVSTLQADLSTHRNVHSPHDTYDKDIQQGLFRKMEADVTGDCETLYSVSPVAAEWRRELHKFASKEEPIEIRKSKNYGHCQHRVEYHFGVPNGAEWSGTAYQAYKNQLIKRATVSRILQAKNGPIYKAETSNTINVHPYVYGKQNAKVLSKITIYLVSHGPDNELEWEQPENVREVKNLLYSLTHKPIGTDSSSTSSESNENQGNPAQETPQKRQRRSTRTKSITINKVVKNRLNHKSSSSSSSSSSSESAYINDNIPTNSEPAYAALYLNPHPHTNLKQNPINAQKLIQELAHQLQNANNMPKGDFLSKFNILVRVITSMDTNQLNQLQNNMEAPRSANDAIKADMQMIYRDAVTEAGTLPAFQQIKSWIQNKKIKGDEAAQVVSALARSLRYPTKEVMSQFFDLAMSPEVRQQNYLNSTMLIASTKLINMAQINNFTANHQYPTHMYGRLAKQDDRFVVDKIIPRLEQEMNQAIEQGDSQKSQVYIRAIGKLGHRKILRVFAPYLEGKKPARTYIRAYMVQNLQYLAIQRDSLTRAILYSILRNTAEPYEVRVAAIRKIMMAQPSSAMMQTMAQMTKDDPSIQVRALLKSVIKSDAQQENTRLFEMARSANAVKGLITKQKFGAQYSGRNVSINFNDEDDLGIVRIFSNVGSEDTLWPKSFKYSQTNRIDGWERTKTFDVSTTSIQRVVDAVSNVLAQVILNKEQTEGHGNEPNHKYTAKKISEMLNIQSNEQEPLEGSIYFDVLNQQRLFTFGDMNEISNTVKTFLNKLSKGVSNHYTKVFNQNQVSIMFPLSSGMPFIYKYKQPTVLHLKGTAISYFKSADQKYKTSTNIAGQFVYAQNYDGKVGFLDTLGNRVASVGVVTKLQINLPAKMNVELNSGEVKYNLKPLNTDQDEHIIHYSVWPYSANQQKDSLVTISHDPETKLITRAKKVVSLDYKIGLQHALQIQGYSYSEDYRNIRNLWKSNNALDNVIAALRQADVAQTHYNIKYLGKQSKAKELSITAHYDTIYNQKQDGQMPIEANQQNDVSPNSENRRQELIKRVVSGINTAKANVLDLSLTYDNQQQQGYAATFAVASSQVDPRVQFAFYAGKNQQGQDQINVAGVYIKPTSTSPLNYPEALKQNMKISLEADIQIGQKQNIHIKGTGERSKQYTEDLQNYPTSNSCLQQVSNDNNYQSDCVVVITKAHAPNNFKFNVNYKGLSNTVRGASAQIQDIGQKLNLWQEEHDLLKRIAPGSEGTLEINADASYPTNSLNMKVHSQSGEIRFYNIGIPRGTAYALATNSPLTSYENTLNKFTSGQYIPSCSVDGSNIRTFSGRSYEYALSRSWHVVLQNWKQNEQEQIAVLARRPAQNQLEMYISYRAPSGNDFEIQVQPSQGNNQPNVNVQTNANMVSQGDLTTYWDNVEDKPLLQYYTENNGVWMMQIQENRVRIMYDGQRLVVFTKTNRNNTRGICGFMSGDPRDDYFSPNGLVDNPKHYGASYALDDENSDPQTKELQNQAKEAAYQPHRRYTAILPADAQYNAAMQTSSSSSSSSEEKWGSQNVYRSRSYLKQQGQCKVQHQVQYYENYGEICITTKPLAACQSHCSGDKYKIQGAQVVCRPKLDQQFQAYRDQIRQGQNPKVNGVPNNKQYRVPGSCKA